MPSGVCTRDFSIFAPRTVSEPIKETRQQYANRRIVEYQRIFPNATWAEVLSAFRYAGKQYDLGEKVAA